VFLNPPEELRRRWKVARDCSRRGYTTDQVLAELDRRESDSESFIRPQRRYADLIVSFLPAGDDHRDPTHLDAELTLRDGLPHPDLASLVQGIDNGLTLVEDDGERRLFIPGRIDPDQAMVVGTELFRSESLALVQLLILYHLVTAKAAIALGGDGGRFPNQVTASS
jgi:phosphoribulokinase